MSEPAYTFEVTYTGNDAPSFWTSFSYHNALQMQLELQLLRPDLDWYILTKDVS